MDLWTRIQQKTNEHGYMSGVDRISDRVAQTGEVFTPTAVVIEMMQQLLADNDAVFAPGQLVFDPACGDGQFLVPVKWYKIFRYDLSEKDALADLYGIDIMRDNVDLCRLRLNGGQIYMGDTLNPSVRLPEQTDEEWEAVGRLLTATMPSLTATMPSSANLEDFYVS